MALPSDEESKRPQGPLAKCPIWVQWVILLWMLASVAFAIYQLYMFMHQQSQANQQTFQAPGPPVTTQPVSTQPTTQRI